METPNFEIKEFLDDVLSLGDQVAGNVIKIRKRLDKLFYEGRRTITFVLVGKTGVGKSRLVNALIGKHKEASEGDFLDPGTLETKAYSIMKHGVEIIVWDSPGLEDGTGDEDNYLKQIGSSSTNIDLLVFCVKMNDTRIRPEDLSTMKKITTTLGSDVWKQAIIALTFANEVIPPSDFGTKRHKEFFRMKLDLFKKKYSEILNQSDVASTVPCVPCGDLGKPVLPIYKNWLSVFWLSSLHRIEAKAKPAMLQANQGRLLLASKRMRETEEEDDSDDKPQAESVVRRASGSRNSESGDRPRSEYGDIVEISREQEEMLLQTILALAGNIADEGEL